MVSKLKQFFCLLLLLGAVGAWPSSGRFPPLAECIGTVYYVAATGSDTNCGNSVDHPWQTVAKVNAFSFPANSTVLFRSVDTFSTTTAITVGENNFTIGSYSGSGQATISSGNSAGCITSTNYSGVVVNNINCVGGGNTTNSTDGIDILNSSTSAHLNGATVTNSTVTGYGRNCVIIGAIGNPAQGFDNVTVTGNIVHDCTGNFLPGISGGGNYKSITACIGTGSFVFSGSEFDPDSRVVFTNFNVSYNIVYNCTGTTGSGGGSQVHTTGLGIANSQGTTGTVNHNIVHNIGANDNYGAEGPIGIQCSWEGDQCTAQFNEIYNVSSQAADGECIDASTETNEIVEYNYVHDGCKTADILFGDFSTHVNNNVTFRFNIVENSNNFENLLLTSCANNLAGCQNLNIYNNTFAGLYSSPTLVVGNNGINNSTTPFSMVLANNIIVGQVLSCPTCTATPTISGDFGTGTTAVIVGNDYAALGTGGTPLHFTPDGGTHTYTTLAAMQGACVSPNLITEETGGCVTPVGTTATPNLNGYPGGSTAPTPGGTCGGYLPPCPTSYELAQAIPAGGGNGLNLNTLFGFSVGSQDFYGNTITAATLPIGANLGPPLVPCTNMMVLVFSNACAIIIQPMT